MNMTAKTDYKPIDCSFHDVLLLKATLKKECRILYVSDAEKIEISDTIEDVYTTKSKEEFLLTGKGLIIRLDKIVQVDNEILSNYNYCEVKE